MSKLIAHRGASILALENTEKAFKLAGEKDNIYAIETDVWITLDGVWICSHDSNPFDDKSIHIHQTKYHDISQLSLDIPNAKYQSSDFSYLCTLDTYLDICKRYKKSPIIELKQANLSKPQLINLIHIIKAKELLANTSFISFNFNNLNLLREIDTQIITYDLIDTKFAKDGSGKKGIRASISLKHNVSVRHFLASNKMIDLVHNAKLFITVWTVDKKRLALKYRKLGVDFITSNDIYLLD